MSHIRSTVHPTVLTGSRHGRGAVPTFRHNNLIDVARDSWYPGADSFGWAMGYLFAVEHLRMDWDSPRIGGGIDPAVATLRGGPDDSSEYESLTEYIDQLRGEMTDDGYSSAAFENHIQDCIVHFEAVLLRVIDQARINGSDY